VKHLLAADVSRETLAALDTFVSLLLRWNRTLNLIARADEPVVWERHILDSLQLVPLMHPVPDRAIDLGSGAGFPGLILSLATHVPFDLVEADQRKASFLREAIRLTHAPAQVHAARIEALRVPPAPLVTARALAPLPRLLDLAAPLLTPDGICLFLKGASVQPELTESASQWHMQGELIQSQTSYNAHILRISNLSRVTPSA
jgi:16S rRNA (guanine527-N7)-methyltransferase